MGAKGRLIARVAPVLADKYLFVQVETRDGRVGVGEAGAWSHIEATAAAIAKFGAYLVGEDSEAIERHWQAMRRFGSYSGAVIMAAVSAVDVALWDLKGQRLGEPIHALLGGPLRDRVRVYGQARGRTREELIESCVLLVRAGYSAVGHVNPFLDDDLSIPLAGTHAARMHDAVTTLEAVRAAIGEADLCVEIHRRLRPAEAIAFGRRIAHLNPLFLEDPIRPDSIAAMAAVQVGIGIGVATGERFHALDQFRDLLVAGAARYLRPCLSLCGGITGGRRVAALAEAFDVDVVPHNTYSPVATAASLHLAAAVPNLLLLEYPTARYTDDEASLDHVAAGLVTRTPVRDGGYVAVPDGPGLGTALIPEVAARHPMRPIPVAFRAHADGSFAEH